MVVALLYPRSSLIHFACIGVAPPLMFKIIRKYSLPVFSVQHASDMCIELLLLILVILQYPRSSLIHFACIGVAPYLMFTPVNSSWTIISRSQLQFNILVRYPQLLNKSACIAFSQHVTTSEITSIGKYSLSSICSRANCKFYTGQLVNLQQVIWDFFLQVDLGFYFVAG